MDLNSAIHSYMHTFTCWYSTLGYKANAGNTYTNDFCRFCRFCRFACRSTAQIGSLVVKFMFEGQRYPENFKQQVHWLDQQNITHLNYIQQNSHDQSIPKRFYEVLRRQRLLVAQLPLQIHIRAQAARKHTMGRVTDLSNFRTKPCSDI